MTRKINHVIRDHTEETSMFGVWVSDAAIATELTTNVDGITLGVLARRSVIEETTVLSNLIPASQWAQVELGIRFYYQDAATADVGFFTIPTPDLDTVVVGAGDSVDLTQPLAMTNLVTWLETNGRSEAGNAISITRAVVVGRNS